MEPGSIINNIARLLYNHNCVIVPDFGGFVANREGAHFLPERQLVYPASKKIAFNGSLKQNDGLLINAITLSEGLSYTEAEQKVKAFVSQINTHLTDKKSFEFREIGTFYHGAEGKLLFIPYRGANFLMESFGLPVLKVRNAAFDKDQMASINAKSKPKRAVYKNAPVSDQPKKKRKIAWAWLVAIPVVLGIGYLGFQQNIWNTPTVVETQNTNDPSESANAASQNADMFAFPHTDSNTKSEETINSTTKEQNTVEQTEPTTQKEIDNTPKVGSFAKTKKVSAQSPTELKYFVVVEALSNPNNIQKLVAKLTQQNYQPIVIEDYRPGLNIVASGGFANKQEALAVLAQSRKEINNKAWLLKQ